MKRFATKSIYFILPLIVIAILMEILLRAIPNDYLFKKQYLDNHSSEIETLILGSSHSFFGFNPEYFSSNTYNASYISQSLKYDYAILKKYQDQLKNLNNIILPISYFLLYEKIEAGVESWRVKNYIIYCGLDSANSLKDYSEVLSMRLNINVKRLVSYYILGNPAISCTKFGWGTDYNSKNARDLAETGKIAAERHTRDNIKSTYSQQIFNENILILNSIIQWGKNNNVKILLLTPPAFESYRMNLNPEQLDITIKTTTEICSKYDNCIYQNLLGDSNFVATDFFDADHLSEIGAKKLSEFIDKIILEWK